MSDLISRQSAVDLIEEMKPYHQDADDIAEMIANMPSAQSERKKGKWRVVSRQADFFTAYRCSECNGLVYARTNFCSNCGAHMKGEAND